MLLNPIRKAVAGKRNRLVEGDYELDLSYVTPRIMAMSYPGATMLQKVYRNDIADVAKFLKDKHGSGCWIHNVSGIPYETSYFGDRVSLYAWEDHHSSTVVLLLGAC